MQNLKELYELPHIIEIFDKFVGIYVKVCSINSVYL